ncbi:hypothetical protein [Mesorhizobium australicum]|uniref:hypothetical protein n=1 Tax=Mesorhizobium australicum TaxID=536018 RepID=UPI0033396AC4
MGSTSRSRVRLLSLIALAILAAGAAAAEPLGADFLVSSRPARIGLTFPDIATTSSYRIRFTGRNSSKDSPVDVAAPMIGPIFAGGAEAMTQAATPKPPVVGDNSCAKPVLAGQTCAFDVQLPPGLAPGNYSFEVILPGKDGGQSAQSVSVDIRASAWLAGIVIALGVALGAAVSDWRTTARPIVNRRILVARFREDVERLAETATQVPVARRVRQLVLELKALDAEILAGGAETGKLAEYRERFELLTRAEALLQAAAQPKERATETFSLLARRLSAGLDAVAWRRETIIATSDTLAAELSGFQSLFEAARRYDLIAARLSSAVAYLGATGETPDWKSALALRQGAFIAIEPDGDGKQTESRAKALNEATAKVEATPATLASELFKKLDGEIAAARVVPKLAARRTAALDKLEKQMTDLKAVQPPTADTLAEAMRVPDELARLSGLENTADKAGDVPVILGPDSGLKFNWPDGAFQPAAGASLAELSDKLKAWDWITNIVALAGIASAGVMVLWMTNTTWGSVQDMLLALLAGAGTRLSIGKIGQPGQ